MGNDNMLKEGSHCFLKSKLGSMEAKALNDIEYIENQGSLPSATNSMAHSLTNRESYYPIIP